MATVQFNPMTKGRAIEWTDVTINPLGGCKHRCRWEMPDGTTAVCYAEQLATNGMARTGYPHGFEHAYWRPKVLRELKMSGPPLLIFPDSMSDLFGSWQEDEHVIAVLDTMREAPQHTFQSLTKNAKRLLKFIDHMPPNLWVGVSSAPDHMMGRRLTADQQERYMRTAVAALAEVRERTGNITWMSLEPVSWDMAHLFAGHTLDWVVIGAAMNERKYYQPAAAHIDRLLDVFDRSGTPVFYKGNIKATFDTYDFGTTAKNRWREDFPVRPSGRGATAIPGPAPAVVRRQAQARVHGWTLNTLLPEAAPEPTPAAPVAVQPALFG